tara:strand:- start:81 stop:296 length:216 start_codon:yes stop_codon:yes gene_type:complete
LVSLATRFFSHPVFSSPCTNVMCGAGWMKEPSGSTPFSTSHVHHCRLTRNFWLTATALVMSTSLVLGSIGV